MTNSDPYLIINILYVLLSIFRCLSGFKGGFYEEYDLFSY